MGFIGFNAALNWAKAGARGLVVDDLSRRTARRNYREFRKLQPARVAIYGDLVPVVDQRDGAAQGCFRDHVTHDHAIGPTRETPVGHESHRGAEAGADDG